MLQRHTPCKHICIFARIFFSIIPCIISRAYLIRSKFTVDRIYISSNGAGTVNLSSRLRIVLYAVIVVCEYTTLFTFHSLIGTYLHIIYALWVRITFFLHSWYNNTKLLCLPIYLLDYYERRLQASEHCGIRFTELEKITVFSTLSSTTSSC